MLAEPFLHRLFNLVTGAELSSTKRFLEGDKQVKITGGKIRAVGADAQGPRTLSPGL